MTQYSKCSRYAINWLDTFNISDPDSIDLKPNASWPTEYCVNGWIYNGTVQSSIVIDVSENENGSNKELRPKNPITPHVFRINLSSSLIWYAIVTSIRQLD